ncbi:MFS transporter [Paraburkholderia solisilvae]|uniref:Putative transporter n=1 Tax=Paraburkholderia solisilvae TaxID=624376 RepID=A0A6J5CXC9_9BURK|nr:MFS transporter [Paraburkholderia solisilvae]CAB3746223.1 putative transporter [Paraburkholderia solisilvae]
MNRSIYWVMALAAGLVVANNYYNQPLLVDFAHTFDVTERAAGAASVAAQTGYALGLLLFVPLGDMVRRTTLFTVTLLAAAASLVATALAPTLAWLIVASFVTSLTSVAPQLLTPLAAQLAGPQQRGRAVGTVMFGLLCGILLSRTVSGVLAASFGWRAVYGMAAVAMVGVVVMLLALMPRTEPAFSGTWRELMGSLWTLLRDAPLIRQTSCIAALQFAAFSAFWTTLAFHLHAMNAHYGSATAGLFGLVGVVGASASTVSGKWTDRGDARGIVLAGGITMLAAYGVFALVGGSIAGLIAGVIVLDFGAQIGHVANMSRNMGVSAGAMNRINTLYMTIRFAGGALGTAVGTFAWSIWSWAGVCAVGLGFAAASVLVQLLAERGTLSLFAGRDETNG